MSAEIQPGVVDVQRSDVQGDVCRVGGHREFIRLKRNVGRRGGFGVQHRRDAAEGSVVQLEPEHLRAISAPVGAPQCDFFTRLSHRRVKLKT